MSKRTLDLSDIPSAHSVALAHCPDCEWPHVVLFDRNNVPFAEFAVPDGFVRMVQDALYSTVAQRD